MRVPFKKSVDQSKNIGVTDGFPRWQMCQYCLAGNSLRLPGREDKAQRLFNTMMAALGQKIQP
ncbi:MAG: hypothetical protein ACLR9W_10225 [Enterobacter hormaechei]